MKDKNNNAIAVPYAIGPTNKLILGCTLDTYTVDELIKVFIAQCYDVGIKNACDLFDIPEESDVFAGIMNVYIRYISSPCFKDPFNFFTMFFSNSVLIKELTQIFSAKIEQWTAEYLVRGASSIYNAEEVNSIVAQNFAVKAVMQRSSDVHACAVGDLSKAFVHVLWNPEDQDYSILINKIVRKQPVNASDAVFTLKAIRNDSSTLIDYFYAILLFFCSQDCTFDSVLQDARQHYNI